MVKPAGAKRDRPPKPLAGDEFLVQAVGEKRGARFSRYFIPHPRVFQK